VALLEVDLAPLLAAYGRRRPLQPVAPYPSVSRDISLVVAQSVRHQAVIEAARERAPEELERIELFDVFTGRGIPDGKKSMAYSLTYRSIERTLTDEEANAYHNRIKENLRRRLEVEIREG
jgi:phenylalanyl-tRNA synthetase beta chain